MGKLTTSLTPTLCGLLDAVRAPSGVLSSDGTILAATPALAALLGVSHDALAGQRAEDFVAPKERWRFRQLLEQSGAPVVSTILSAFRYTLQLTFVGIAVGSLLGIPLGVIAAIRRDGVLDYVLRTVSLVGLSIPAFYSALLLLFLFAAQFPLFRVIGDPSGLGFWGQIRALVLPTLNMRIIMAGSIVRATRAAMLDVLGEEYVRTATAKGLRPAVVLFRHALCNPLIPAVTVIGHAQSGTVICRPKMHPVLRRNFEVFSALGWLAALTAHIPNAGEHLVWYCGWYSSVSRGKRRKAIGREQALPGESREVSASAAKHAWARLIKQDYEVVPLVCPRCAGPMRLIAFIDHTAVIERIFAHIGLWPAPGHSPPASIVL